ncbi:MAG: hypothetical protein ACPG4T_00290 [Nannocystaceae bacterium]
MSWRRALLALFMLAGLGIWWLGSPASPPTRGEAELAKKNVGPVFHKRRVLASEPPKPRATRKQELPDISLIDAGNEPRELLRLQLEQGIRQELVLDLKVVVATALGQQQAPRVQMPTLRIHALLEVTGITDAGHAHTEFTIQFVRVLEAPGVMPGLSKAMRDGMSHIEGYRGYLVVDDRGRTHEAEFDISDDLPDEIKQMLEGLHMAMNQLTLPLPKDPVGPGASWAVLTKRVKPSGVFLDQTVTYQIEQYGDDEVALGFEILQTADSQKLEFPNLPEGAEVRLTTLASNGGGHSVLPLAQILPRKSHLEMASEIQMTVSLGTLREPAAMFMDVELTILEQ